MEKLAGVKPTPAGKVPASAWVVVSAGIAINLCYGTKNLGVNYGLILLGSVLGFFMFKFADSIRNRTGSLAWASTLSAILLISVVILARVTKRPVSAEG